jgi:hypothetical protein
MTEPVIDLGGFFMGGLIKTIIMPAISDGVSARADRDNSRYHYDVYLDDIQNHDEKLLFYQMLENMAKTAKIKKHVLKSHPVHLSTPERVRVFRHREDSGKEINNDILDTNGEPILLSKEDDKGNVIISQVEYAERYVAHKLIAKTRIPPSRHKKKDTKKTSLKF